MSRAERKGRTRASVSVVLQGEQRRRVHISEYSTAYLPIKLIIHIALVNSK